MIQQIRISSEALYLFRIRFVFVVLRFNLFLKSCIFVVFNVKKGLLMNSVVS